MSLFSTTYSICATTHTPLPILSLKNTRHILLFDPFLEMTGTSGCLFLSFTAYYSECSPLGADNKRDLKYDSSC